MGGADLVLCNPPYVKTTEEEVEASLEVDHSKAAWAGGEEGRRVTDQLFLSLPELLSTGGRCYLVVEQCNGVDRVANLAERQGLRTEVAITRRAGRELLYVLRLEKQKS